jgi:hypothetical protein
MALTAMKETDEPKVKAKDFNRALSTMRNAVKSADENNAESRGDLSAAWAIVVEECGCASAAAKFFRKQILEASEEKRDDNLRTLYGLMRAADIGISRDLIDTMNGTEAPTMPVVELFKPAPQNPKPEARAPLDDDELDNVVDAIPEEKSPSAAAKRGRGKPNLVTVQ